MAQIGDILAKLGRREALTTAEQQQIRLWGNQVDNSNAFISGIQNSQSNISANNIDSRNITVGRNFPGGERAMIWYRGNVPTGASYTTIPIQAIFFNELFSVNSNTITFNKSGFYLLSLEFSFATLTTGQAVISYQGLSASAVFSNIGTHAKYRSITKGSTMYLQGKHDEAGTEDFYIFLYFELLREYEQSVTT